VVEDNLEKLRNRFGQESTLVTSPGKIFECLGMTINYTNKGKLKLSTSKKTK